MAHEKETGYEAKIDCECIPCKACGGEGVDEESNEGLHERPCEACKGTGNDSQDCPVHTDVDGSPFSNGVCCKIWAEHHAGRHAYNCGNYAAPMAYPVDSQEAF